MTHRQVIAWAAVLVAPRIGAALCLLVATSPPAAAAVTGACPVSPIVADLDRSVIFYRDLLGFEVSTPPRKALAWDSSTEGRRLYGLSGGRLRSVTARIPGATCGIELVEFAGVDRKRLALRMQDPGAVTLILLVRDIEALSTKLRAAGVRMVSTGGVPVLPAPASKTRALIVRDPDGQFVELAQLDPAPSTTAPASTNVFDVRFRLTVGDLDEAIQFYEERLGLALPASSFATSPGVMAMMGLPDSVEYRVNMGRIPGSSLILEFLELRGLDRKTSRPRVQDPGAYRLQLLVNDLDGVLTSLRATSERVISTGGMAVRLAVGQPSRAAVIQDPNNLFLVLIQQP
jgi:catechol 2,3-dioxygenase-like lactoylglutathione lyase family enzyme